MHRRNGFPLFVLFTGAAVYLMVASGACTSKVSSPPEDSDGGSVGTEAGSGGTDPGVGGSTAGSGTSDSGSDATGGDATPADAGAGGSAGASDESSGGSAVADAGDSDSGGGVGADDPGSTECESSELFCGGRCLSCPSENGEAICVDGQCGIECDSDFHECDSSCVKNDSAKACGPDCVSCDAPDNASPICADEACDFACNGGYIRDGAGCVAQQCDNDDDCDDALGCTDDTCNTSSNACEFVLAADSCVIDGACVASGTLDPENDCLSCQPGIDDGSYSPVMMGTDCDPRDRDRIFPTCDDSGVCGSLYCEVWGCWSPPTTAQTQCSADAMTVTACPGNPGSASCSSIAGCGQDAQYAPHERTFSSQTLSGDIVDTDDDTSLMWQRTLSDCDSSTDNGDACSFALADAYCTTLTYAGFSDWRLPQIAEFVELMAPSEVNPATHLPGTADATNYWSSTSVAADSTLAWEASFSFLGAVGVLDKSGGALARCVRGEPRSRDAAERFLEESAGADTVAYDRATGLTWQVTPDLSGMTWLEALAHCEGLSYAGQSDWRLPDLHELSSLIDFGATTTLSALPGATSDAYWSSSHGYLAGGSARGVEFATPSVSSLVMLIIMTGTPLPPLTPFSSANDEQAVRCVRGP